MIDPTVLPAFSPPVLLTVRLDSRGRSELGATGDDETEYTVLAMMALSSGQCRYLVLAEGMFQPRWAEPQWINRVATA